MTVAFKLRFNLKLPAPLSEHTGPLATVTASGAVVPGPLPNARPEARRDPGGYSEVTAGGGHLSLERRGGRAAEPLTRSLGQLEARAPARGHLVRWLGRAFLLEGSWVRLGSLLRPPLRGTAGFGRARASLHQRE